MIEKKLAPSERAFSLFAFDLFPIFLGSFFGFVVAVEIIFFILYVIGKILLIDLTVGIIVGVFVALEKRALQMLGNGLSKSRLDVLQSRINRQVLSV